MDGSAGSLDEGAIVLSYGAAHNCEHCMHLPASPLDDDEGFHSAVLIYCESILRLHWNERLINKVFGKAMQSHAAGRVAIQHCRALEFGEPPPTTAWVLAGTASGRRTVASFLLLLRMVGMLQVGTSVHDGRQRPLIPQPRLMDGLRQWLAHHLRCAHALGLADASDADALGGDARFFQAYVARSGPILERITALQQRFPASQWFDSREGGHRIALWLLQAHARAWQARAGRREPAVFELKAQAIAGGLGLSLTHVHSVLREATQRGYLLAGTPRGQGQLSAQFLADYRAWLTTSLDWFGQTARLTRSALSSPQRPA